MKSRTKPVEDLVIQNLSPIGLEPQNEAEPDVLDQVQPRGCIEEFDRLRSALTQTHQEIPALLAAERDIAGRLGLVEARGDGGEGLKSQLDETVRQRQAAIRKRSACVDAIVAMEQQLQVERAAVEAERREHAVEAVAQFQARYNAAVANLQALWEEGRLLGETLRTTVPMPLPVRLVTHPVDGSTRAQPIRADIAVTVDAGTAKLGERANALDGALAMIGAIKQSKEIDARHFRLSQERSTAGELSGVFKVMLPFRCLVDGCDFAVGDLVDHTLIGHGNLQRLTVGRRFVQPVELAARAA
jgi:hypothetical protein